MTKKLANSTNLPSMFQLDDDDDDEEDVDNPEEMAEEKETSMQFVLTEEKPPPRPAPTKRNTTTSPTRLTNTKSRNGTQESSNGTNTDDIKPKRKAKVTKTTTSTSTNTTDKDNTSPKITITPKTKKPTKVVATKVVVKPTQVAIKIRKTRLLSAAKLPTIIAPPISPISTRSTRTKVMKTSPSSTESTVAVVPKIKIAKVKTKSPKSISEPYMPMSSESNFVVCGIEENSSGVTNGSNLQVEMESPTPSMETPAPMTIDQMRISVAKLLQRISTPERLKSLGFGKRAIDDVLHDSISTSGRKPCEEELAGPAKFRKNVDILLEWTIPPEFMVKFRKEQRTTEELLEELTS